MSLPRISYKNYNYGQYANPTPIKYKGGLGQGLAAAGRAYFIAKEEKALQKQEKEKQDRLDKKKQNKTRLDNYEEFMKDARSIIDLLDPHNAKVLKEMADEDGQNKIDYENGIINFEEYTKKDNLLQSGKQGIITLFKNSVEDAKDKTIKPFTFYKNTQENLNKYSLDVARQNGLIKLDRDEDGVPLAGYAMFKDGAENGGEIIYLPINEINRNPSLHSPSVRFVFDEKKYKGYGEIFQNKLDTQTDIKTKIVKKKSGDQEIFDAQSAINFVKNTDVVEKEAYRVGKSVWEDILGEEEDYDVDKHLDEVKDVVAAKILDYTDLKIGKVSESDAIKVNQNTQIKYIDDLDIKIIPAIGPAEEGRPLIDFDELESSITKPPLNITTLKAEKVGGREARTFSKTVKGEDRKVTVYDNTTVEELKAQLKFLETGVSAKAEKLEEEEEDKFFQYIRQ